MGIWAYARKIWPSGVSPKRESKMQLRDVNQRSLGHSNQKLWPKVDLGEFHHVYPLEHLKSFATDRLWVYNAENFFVAFSRYIYSAVSTIKQNFKKWLFWDTLLYIEWLTFVYLFVFVHSYFVFIVFCILVPAECTLTCWPHPPTTFPAPSPPCYFQWRWDIFFFDRMILEKLFDGKLRLGKDFPKL